MKLDTSAATSLISVANYQKTFPDISLHRSPVFLKTYTGQELEVVGEVEVVKYEQQSAQLPLGKGPSLLGRNWLMVISELERNQCSSKASERKPHFLENYKGVFSDELGMIKTFHMLLTKVF